MTEEGFIARSTSRPVVSSGDLTDKILEDLIEAIKNPEYREPQAPVVIVSPSRYKEIMASPELRRLYGVKEEDV